MIEEDLEEETEEDSRETVGLDSAEEMVGLNSTVGQHSGYGIVDHGSLEMAGQDSVKEAVDQDSARNSVAQERTVEKVAHDLLPRAAQNSQEVTLDKMSELDYTVAQSLVHSVLPLMQDQNLSKLQTG